jgi:uncharacterized protein YjbI with pentapeptide repeats
MRIWAPIVDTYQGGASKRFAFFAVVLGALLLAALVFFLLAFPGIAVDADGLTPAELAQRESDARSAGLQALAGIVVAIGGSFTAFSVLSNREGQLDERFARALELLTSEDPYIARGAVYSLERIAAQSRFDRPSVVDVLAGFIKDGAPEDRGEAPGYAPAAKQESLDALTVLGRIKGMPGSPAPDLEGTYWKGTSLASKDLSGMRLAKSRFQSANLHGANLSEANLLQAKFSRANLLDADLRGADLRYADLDKTTLLGTQLQGANLAGANLDEAVLGADADLSGTELAGASLRGAELATADLSGARLSGAILTTAEYSPETRFPQGFDPDKEGMVARPLSSGENANGDF